MKRVRDEALEQEVVLAYTENKWSLREIAEIVHVSHTTISKWLLRNGIDTSKAVGCHITKPCAYCEKPVTKKRKAGRKLFRFFCDADCYYGWLKIRNIYIPNRHQQVRGRGTVASIYGPLPPGAIVHHKDGNCFNNDPGNLMLLASQGDHITWHRGDRSKVTPLWSG